MEDSSGQVSCSSIARVAGQGMALHVLNMTPPDVGMPVVKVMVPGIRHFWSRHAPGRLYDVPVFMGWLTAPLAEAELNPTPIFWWPAIPVSAPTGRSFGLPAREDGLGIQDRYRYGAALEGEAVRPWVEHVGV